MTKTPFPTRTVAFLSSAVVLLLTGSYVLLSQVNFKAAESNSTIYFSDAVISAKLGTDTKVDVTADVTKQTQLIGAQMTITFDPTELEFADATPLPNWQTVYSKVEPGRLTLVVVPTGQATFSTADSQVVNLDTLRFRAIGEGSSTLKFDPASTILAGEDTGLGRSISNLATSVQDAQISVSSSAASTEALRDQVRVDAAVDQSQDANFNSQRIISDDQLLMTNSALILVHLQHPARISVRFGPTKELGNLVNYTESTDQAAVRINGLQAGQRYFYQVVASNSDNPTQTIGQIKSFQLPLLSDQTAADHASLTIFPAKTDLSTTAYAVFYDASGKVIAGLKPQFTVDTDQFRVSSVSEGGGLYLASVTRLQSTKAIAQVGLGLDGHRFASTTAVIDPSANQTTPNPINFPTLAIDQKTINILIALVGALILLGFGFYRLVRN